MISEAVKALVALTRLAEATLKDVGLAKFTPPSLAETAWRLQSDLTNARAAVEAESALTGDDPPTCETVTTTGARDEAVSTTYECSECESPIDPRTDVVVCSECLIAAREKAEAVEHAMARKGLEEILREAKRYLGFASHPTVIAAFGDLCERITDQLSILGARNFEVVTIPQGERKDIDQMDKKG